jgi:hypothetical protein
MRIRLLAFTAALLLLWSGCGAEEPEITERVTDVYPDSTRKVVENVQGDSVVAVERYRPTGSVMRIERGDSVRTYLDIHPADSAYVLKDFLLGRWRSIGIDTTDASNSLTYIFRDGSLTFLNPQGEVNEHIGIRYDSLRTLYTEAGTPFTTEIVDFDTVRISGYTLVREGLQNEPTAETDDSSSAPSPNAPSSSNASSSNASSSNASSSNASSGDAS